MPYLDERELVKIGFKALGQNVCISDKCLIYNAAAITIGNCTRIDDFSVVSAGRGGITIGDHVHVACFCSLQGAAHIVLDDYSGLSSRVAVYSSTDDYSGTCLTNPTVPARFRNVVSAPVFLDRHVIVGTGSVILPGVRIGLGAAVGAMSLVRKNCEPFGIYFGIPAKRISSRSTKVLELEQAHSATALNERAVCV